MSAVIRQLYEFGEFRLDPQERVLFKNEVPVSITPKVFGLLLLLVENHGRIVEKDFLMSKLWADSFVEESNLTFNIRQLRKIFEDDSKNPRYIETVARRGYRFIAPVKEVMAEEDFPSQNFEFRSKRERLEKAETAIERGFFEQGEEISISEKPAFVKSTNKILSKNYWAAIFAIVFLAMFFLAGYDLFLNRNRAKKVQTKTLTAEKLTDTGNGSGVAISPDGKLLAYYTVEGGKNTIWLRHFATGKSIPIFSLADETINGVDFSRSGEFLFFTHQAQGGETQLSKVSILGGAPSKILNGIHTSYSFSPDDKQIAFVRIDDAASKIIIADADGENQRAVLTIAKPRSIIGVSWSPDGKFLAYSAGNYHAGEKDYGVYELELESGKEIGLTNYKWSFLTSVMWLPEKSGLLVNGRYKPEQTDQIWLLSLPGGEVEKLSGDSYSLALRNATADFSKIVATQRNLNTSIWIAPSSNLSDIKPIVKAQHDVSWTPDGKLVFTARDTIKTDLWTINADGSDKKQLTANEALEKNAVASPDGKFIVFISNQSGHFNLWRANADGSNQTQLTNSEGEANPSLTPDGKTIVFNSIKDGSLWRIASEGGEPALVSAEKTPESSLSPDGTKFAYFGRKDNKRKLLVKSFPDCRLLNEFEIVITRATPPKIVWADEGKSLIFDNMDSSYVSNLWKLSLAGGEPQKLTNFTSEQIFDFAFSPDGKQLALVRGVWSHDAILLKGLSNENSSSD